MINSQTIANEFLSVLSKHCKEKIQEALGTLDRIENDLKKKISITANERKCEAELHKECPLPPSCAFNNTTQLKYEELQELVGDPHARIPSHFSDIQLNFNREQKLRIYEHIVERTGYCTEPEPKISLLERSDGLTFAQIVATKKREKKMKRRFRVSKPTHTEERRALLNLQMQSWELYLQTRKEPTERRRRSKSPLPVRNRDYCKDRGRSENRLNEDHIVSKRSKDKLLKSNTIHKRKKHKSKHSKDDCTESSHKSSEKKARKSKKHHKSKHKHKSKKFDQP